MWLDMANMTLISWALISTSSQDEGRGRSCMLSELSQELCNLCTAYRSAPPKGRVMQNVYAPPREIVPVDCPKSELYSGCLAIDSALLAPSSQR